MPLTFDNRVALVTGAGRGIGRAIAEALGAAGVHVICISKSENSCGSTAEAIRSKGGKASHQAVDVSDASAVSAASATLIETFGNIDILINNAGITRDTLLLRMTDEDWNQVIETNLSSCFHWTKHLLRPMTRKRWGRIINIASVVGLIGNPGQVNYAAAKAGMIGMTKAVAREVASRKVTANAIAPGFIETDMTATLSDEVKEKAQKSIPLKRFGKTSEVAAITAFLASEQSAYITGQTFSVDGGLAM